MSSLRYAEPVAVAPGVRRVTQRNPGPFTGPGTNTFLVGDANGLVILEPGEETEEHRSAVIDAVGAAKVVAIIPSHSHPDHWPLAPALAARFSAPVRAFAPQGFEALPLADRSEVPGFSGLEVVHTPGHASDHVALVDHERRLTFSGDHVMGWSTTIISPPDGSLNQYMTSLDVLRDVCSDVGATKLLPAHGETVEDGLGRIDELARHRRARTEQAVSALREQGSSSIEQLVKTIYRDVDESLHGAAARSLLAHLEALEEEGAIERSDDATGALYTLR